MPFELTINVSDLQASKGFYERCGFEVKSIRAYMYMVRNKRYGIYLNEADDFRPAVHMVRTTNLKGIREELTGKGVAIDPPIRNDDGHLEMVVIDPDGNEMVCWEDPEFDREKD